MTEILIWIACIVVGPAVILLATQLAMAVGCVRARITPCSKNIANEEYGDALAHLDGEQLASLGFARDGVFTVNIGVISAVFATWRRGRESAYLAVYNSGGEWHIDMVSVLSLDPPVAVTSTIKDSAVAKVEVPGFYGQSFSDIDLSTLWELNNNAEVYLADRHNLESIGTQMTTAESLRWYLRREGVYQLLRPWVMVTGSVKAIFGLLTGHNKTVEQRYG